MSRADDMRAALECRRGASVPIWELEFHCWDTASGGRFILSTGDQCGRDTPQENLRAMIETARTYGRYQKP